MGEMVGMTQATYSRKENGFTRISNSEWELLAKKLDVSLDEIYGEDAKTIIYKNKEGNNNFNFGTIHINIPDFIVNYMELLREQNELLKSENQVLKDQIKDE